MSEENKSSEGLEQSVDSGIDAARAAKGAYDTAQSIGAAAAEAGAAAAESAAAAGTAAGPGGTVDSSRLKLPFSRRCGKPVSC